MSDDLIQYLPPLPESSWYVWCHNAYENPYYSYTDGYTADEMTTYAEEAVRSFREADEALMRQALEALGHAAVAINIGHNSIVALEESRAAIAALRARLGESK